MLNEPTLLTSPQQWFSPPAQISKYRTFPSATDVFPPALSGFSGLDGREKSQILSTEDEATDGKRCN